MNISNFVVLDETSPSGLVWAPRPTDSFMSRRSAGHFNNTRAGKPAGFKGTDQNGYCSWKIEIKGRYFTVSRIIWEILHGKIPEGMLVEHRNGNALDNSIANLRLANRVQNRANSKVGRHNKSGLKGVQKQGKRWMARIGTAGQNYLGSFDSPEEAHAAYVEAAKRMFGEFSRSS